MGCSAVNERVEPLAGRADEAPPLLSVVIPALSASLELRRCVDSIRLALADQATFEILVVVPSPQVQAATERLEGVRVLAESRPSVYAAMNDGVAASKGQYLYFIGLDDILLPTAREVLKLLVRESPSVVFADVYWGDKGVHRTDSSRWAILWRNVCHQGIFYSRDVLLRHGPYVRRFKVRADQLLNIRILWDPSLRQRACVLRVPVAWYAGSGLSSVSADRLFYKVQPVIIRRYMGAFWAQVWRTYKRIRPEKGMR
jgi:glycosyltransferase involved in cell wall biosynthesis